MFQHGRVFALNGYAHHCLRALEREPPLYVLNDGQQRRLRVTEADKTAVLRSMNPWVRLCTEACEAEFPHFHLFMSLKVLDLKRTTTGSTSAEVRRSLRRLSLALNLDEHRLQSEYECLEPVAKAFVDTQTVRAVKHGDKPLSGHKTQQLFAPSIRWKSASFATSTCILDHINVRCRAVILQSWKKPGGSTIWSKAADTERRSMICLTYKDSPATPKSKVIAQAREYYSSRVSRHLGKHGRVRFDKGVRRKRSFHLVLRKPSLPTEGEHCWGQPRNRLVFQRPLPNKTMTACLKKCGLRFASSNRCAWEKDWSLSGWLLAWQRWQGRCHGGCWKRAPQKTSRTRQAFETQETRKARSLGIHQKAEKLDLGKPWPFGCMVRTWCRGQGMCAIGSGASILGFLLTDLIYLNLCSLRLDQWKAWGKKGLHK